jgi:ligand-binding SRPBCC domain-containing protein
MNQTFSAEQFVPLSRDQVFEFFSTPHNLEAITPPWLKFRIVHESAPRPGEGVEYTYKLLMRGIPMKWRSRLTEWVPGERFVDIQLQGPYAEWHHTHTFEDAEGGTLIRDHVSYRLPLGWLGLFFGGRFVAADVRRIFDYRKRRTAELLAEVHSGFGGVSFSNSATAE